MKHGFLLKPDSGREYIFFTVISALETQKVIEKELKNDANSFRYEMRRGELHFDSVSKKFKGTQLCMGPIEYIKMKKGNRDGEEGEVLGLYCFSKHDLRNIAIKRWVIGVSSFISLSIVGLYLPVIYSLLQS